MGKFAIKKTNTGYTISLKAGNGEVIGIGGEVFSSLKSAENSIESIKKNAPVANIEDQTIEGFEVIEKICDAEYDEKTMRPAKEIKINTITITEYKSEEEVQ